MRRRTALSTWTCAALLSLAGVACSGASIPKAPAKIAISDFEPTNAKPIVTAPSEAAVALSSKTPACSPPVVAPRVAAPEASADVSAQMVSGETSASAPGAPASPDADAPTLPIGVPTYVQIEGDHDVLVFHAPLEIERTIFYLHGLCGDRTKIESWAPSAARYGTIVALMGNRSCGRSTGRFKWGYSVRLLNERIVAAAERVAEVRGGHLNTEQITLIGYSQGAQKAELMPRHFPDRYTHLVLAAGPRTPNAWRLEPTRAVVIVGGEWDRTSHLRVGLRNMLRAGQLASYLEFPKARHGEFGPEGTRVMETALWWLFDRAPDGEPLPNGENEVLAHDPPEEASGA